jgi:hypothetical protein
MPVMTVKIPVTQNDMMTVADWVWERTIINEFEDCVIEFADLRREEFCQALIDNRDFQQLVGNQVVECGRLFLDDPGDYTDSWDLVKDIRPLNELLKWLYEVVEILDDVQIAENDHCADAIETLKRAGFKVVRA